MTHPHLFHLGAIPPQHVYPKGSRTDATKSLFPALTEMSISLLTISPKGFREPHWHPNAHELSYCLQGKALMTIFSPGAGHDSFIIEPGCLAFVPMGYLHHIQNLGTEDAKFLVCFSDAQSEDINLSSAVGVMPSHVLGSTFKLSPSFFEGLHASVKPSFFAEGVAENHFPNSWDVNRFKKDMEKMQPQIQSGGGTVRLNNQSLMPSLEGLTLYSLRLEPKGIREPHWHPNAHELNYVIQGKVRILLLSPDGKVDDFEMTEGDISFMPRGYFHYIENLDPGVTRMVVFFNHVFPSDIGLSGCLGAYPNELLAQLFKVPVDYFNRLPKYQEDLFVVAGGG